LPAGIGIFVPPQVLTCSGSKGMISACKGTPKDIEAKVIKNYEMKEFLSISFLFDKSLYSTFFNALLSLKSLILYINHSGWFRFGKLKYIKNMVYK